MEKRDILVIGSGPGGAITAWESLKNNRDVLLIEAGADYRLDSCKPYSSIEMEQKYKYGGLTPTFNSPRISYVEGGCVGGGSEVNSGFYHRIPSEIINQWKKNFKIKSFDEDKLLKHYEIIEKEISVSYIPNQKDIAIASLKMKEGADKLGWENIEVPRWYKFSGVDNGVKQSMTETYIKWYLNAGGELKSGLKAINIKNHKNIWTVKCIEQKSKKIIKIKAKHIFVCGGAISTPFLLRASGIKKNIGDTLQMHPTVKVVAEFKETINSHDMGVPVHQVKEFSPDISFGCSISSKPYLALSMLDNEKYMYKVESKWKKMAIYYAMIKPSGFGSVKKIPFFNDPIVRFNLSTNDLKLLSDALKKLCTLLFKANAKNIFPSIKNYGVIKSLSDLESIPTLLPLNKTNLMTIHLFSSCPMGENRKICAANSFGKVYGHDNLFINDGSILPTAPSVNPQGSILSIARRNIHHFLGVN